MFCALFVCGLWRADPAFAHASEQGLVLLLPTSAYATAGTLTVIASILLVTYMPKQSLFKLFQGHNLGLRQFAYGAGVPQAVSGLSSVILLALVFVGIQGPTDPQNNLLPLTIWTVWWVGMFILQGTLFDVWRWVNPWTGITALLDIGEKPLVRLPARLSAWPALGVFLAFQTFLLADVAPTDPHRLAVIVLGYWLFTLFGIVLFGREDWLARGECFGVIFNLLSLLRPFQGQGGLHLGAPGWFALRQKPLNASLAAFCIVLLAAGSFDGLHETFWWLALIGINPLEFPGRSAVVGTSTLGMAAAILLLVAVFSVSVWIGLKALKLRGSEENIPFIKAFCMFSITLLPIALGYHFSHYLVSFMVQIKYTLSTAADPMARGWNLFGLGAVKVTTGFLGRPETVKVIWLTQATVVVLSHVVSVLMGHHVASKLCRDNKDVALLQVGLTCLMIAYTVFGLWLLASPRGA
ncbi:MAG: hypothetical protein ABJJ53_17425 [Sulfitobacter sp.]